MKPRTIEVFTAGCPVCSETLVLVKRVTKDCGCWVVEKKAPIKPILKRRKHMG